MTLTPHPFVAGLDRGCSSCGYHRRHRIHTWQIADLAATKTGECSGCGSSTDVCNSWCPSRRPGSVARMREYLAELQGRLHLTDFKATEYDIQMLRAIHRALHELEK